MPELTTSANFHDRQLTEARNELSRLREQNWEIKKEVLRLNGLCKDYEALLVQQREQSLSADTDDAACLDDVDAESDTNSDIKPDAYVNRHRGRAGNPVDSDQSRRLSARQ